MVLLAFDLFLVSGILQTFIKKPESKNLLKIRLVARKSVEDQEAQRKFRLNFACFKKNTSDNTRKLKKTGDCIPKLTNVWVVTKVYKLTICVEFIYSQTKYWKKLTRMNQYVCMYTHQSCVYLLTGICLWPVSFRNSF